MLLLLTNILFPLPCLAPRSKFQLHLLEVGRQVCLLKCVQIPRRQIACRQQQQKCKQVESKSTDARISSSALIASCSRPRQEDTSRTSARRPKTMQIMLRPEAYWAFAIFRARGGTLMIATHPNAVTFFLSYSEMSFQGQT